MSILAENRRAFADYEILESFEAGLSLFGFEVKAIRQKRMDLAGSYVVVRGNEAYLLNAKIPPLQPKNVPATYEEDRTRKLLLKKGELKTLVGKANQKGLTLMPLKVYNKGRYIKIEIGIARGKKVHEKREAIRKREAERLIERTLKNW
jgi:SsrA-binding protein